MVQDGKQNKSKAKDNKTKRKITKKIQDLLE